MMALRILHNEQFFRHVGVVQRLLSCERLMSSAVQPAVVVDGKSPKDENKPDGEKNHPPKILAPFRTKESDTTKHSEQHRTRFYTLTEEVKDQLFKLGGLPREFSDLAHVFTETSIMVRKPFLEIKEYIESVDFSKPAVRIVLYGKLGLGKSMTLAHVVNYGYDAGFLLVHVPWVNSFTRRCKDAAPSETKPGFMDVPINGSAWLVHFRNQNSQLLKNLNMKTTMTYQFGPHDTITEGSTIEELIEFGIGRAKYSCDVTEVLLREVKNYSNSGLFKTMVVIDGFNGLFTPYIYTDRGLKIYEKCSLVLPFLDMTRFDWCNGICILSVDRSADHEPTRIENDLPYQILGKEGWEHLDPFIPIEVGKYDSAEFDSVVDYYIDRRWIQHPSGKTEEGRLELETISARSPLELMRICAPL